MGPASGENASTSSYDSLHPQATQPQFLSVLITPLCSPNRGTQAAQDFGNEIPLSTSNPFCAFYSRKEYAGTSISTVGIRGHD